MARDKLDQYDLAAERFDDLPTDHLFARVVRTLDEDGWLDPRNQFLGRVLVEHHNEIDGFQSSEHLGASLHRLDRATGAFQPCHGSIAIKADDESITGRARAGEQLDVTGVQQVETAIGEADPEPLPAPLRKVFIEDV